MSSALRKRRLFLRLLAGCVGALLFAHLIRQAGPSRLLESFAALGWGLLLVLAWGGVAHVLRAWAWRLTLLEDKRHVSFTRMLGLRLASEAVGHFGALGQLFGEGLRVSLLGPAMPLASGITSVTVDRALFILSAALVSIVGLSAVLVALPLPHTLALYAGVSVCTLLGVVLLTAVAVKKRWPVLSGTAHLLGRARYFSGWIGRERSLIQLVENNLLDLYHHNPGSFWASFLLHVASHAAAVFEVYLILWLIAAKVSFIGAFAIEALTKLVNVIGTFNPGNVGTYEGGNMIIVKMFGLTGATGLVLAFTRRLRALFWTAVGGLSIVMLAKTRKQSNLTARESDVTSMEPQPISSKELHTRAESIRHSHIAVILANHMDGIAASSPLPRVGTLPILLRSILAAQKAGAARIVVVIGNERHSQLQHDLLQTGRLPRDVEWCELSSGDASLPLLLGKLGSEIEGHLALIAGDRIYHPSLHRRAGEWDGENAALALMNADELVGIGALTSEVSSKLARECRANADTFEELYDWLTSNSLVQCDFVPEDKWQQILTERQRLSAEDKLNHWLVKPTDGIFARMNRRVSIPISRQIIRFPITPNMVSLFTLGVSFAAGVFFALGGYWHMLTGAVLSWFASVLDGCDGEVARLKLQESEFGCWLETICDYLYYLFIFIGMTIGLVRESGSRSYLAWGALLIFGALASFFTTGLQRHHLTSGRPEQYLGTWHKEAESRSLNPFLFLGRHTEFIIRRCFLPYAFLFFALFNIINVAFIVTSLGANVVWIITLYSHLTFAPARTPRMPAAVLAGEGV